jgi:hypothetical protein
MTDALTWLIWGSLTVLTLYTATVLTALIVALVHMRRGDR